MNLAELDQQLQRYRQAADAMSTNLLDLEGDSNRKLLDGATLTGESARRWGEAKGALAQLWQWFSRFQDVVTKATELRGTRSRIEPDKLRQVEILLCGQSIELSTEQIPLAERPLLGPTQTSLHCSLDDLLGRMSSTFEQIKAMVVQTGEAWNNLLPRLQAATTELNRLTGLAATLAEQHVPELDEARAGLDRLTATLASDPLSVDQRAAADVERTLAVAGSDLDRLAALRDRLGLELQQADQLMDELSTAVADAQAAHAENRLKISRPAVQPPPPLDPATPAELQRIATLSKRGQWRAARQALDAWTKRTNQQIHDMRRATDACWAPLTARNELRGRLDAYRAKANAFGLLEDPDAEAVYNEARSILYTAPTDLAVAVSLVDRYQKAVSSRQPTPRYPDEM
jgi:hypothetical protein